MAIQYLKRGDTLPALKVTLRNPDDSIHDLTGVDKVWLHVRLENGEVFTREMTIDPDPTTGVARYSWSEADWTAADPAVKLVAGLHRMEFEVRGSGDGRLTVPNLQESEYVLQIDPDIGHAA